VGVVVLKMSEVDITAYSFRETDNIEMFTLFFAEFSVEGT